MSQPTLDPIQAIEAALQQAYIFSKLSPAELMLVSGVAQWVTFTQPSQLTKEGKPCDSMYVLAKGRLVVKEAITTDSELVIARMAPGDVVAELGFVDGQPASATVRTDGPVELVKIGYAEFRSLLAANPALETTFYRELVQMLGNRIRNSNRSLRQTLLGSMISRA
ncbi:MAG TPA: cyclic nucleotide-binding domain-containing protein [Roseimicrobium sp.]|nr:cyclic nucleotide-binding domain-containing protein [Roseimicrobium sp.]